MITKCHWILLGLLCSSEAQNLHFSNFFRHMKEHIKYSVDLRINLSFPWLSTQQTLVPHKNKHEEFNTWNPDSSKSYSWPSVPPKDALRRV